VSLRSSADQALTVEGQSGDPQTGDEPEDIASRELRVGRHHLREKPILCEKPNLLRTGAIPRWIESSDFAIEKRNGHTSSVESVLCLLSSE
jgi:hypothetical protein